MPDGARKRRWRRQKGELQGWHCFWCGADLRQGGDTLDPLVPRSQGGKWSVLNLVLACRPCNERRGCQTVREFVKGSSDVAVS